MLVVAFSDLFHLCDWYLFVFLLYISALFEHTAVLLLRITGLPNQSYGTQLTSFRSPKSRPFHGILVQRRIMSDKHA